MVWKIWVFGFKIWHELRLWFCNEEIDFKIWLQIRLGQVFISAPTPGSAKTRCFGSATLVSVEYFC